MTRPVVAAIVEGHGEVAALPALLHRLVLGVRPDLALNVLPPQRVPAKRFLSGAPEHRRVSDPLIEAAARQVRAAGAGLVLVLLDSDDALPCSPAHGPALIHRVGAICPDVPSLVVLVHCEYETWFIAAARSLRGVEGLAGDLGPLDPPDRVRDAKNWLGRHMPYGYDPVDHQLPLTRAFSFDEAAAVPSFARLRDRLHAWLATLPTPDA